MTELRKMVVNILSMSGWVALEAVILLGFALLIVQGMGPEQVGVETQSGILVAVAVLGGVILETVRRHFTVQVRSEIWNVAGMLQTRTKVALRRTVESFQGLRSSVASLPVTSLRLFLHSVSYRDVLVPELSNQFSDFELFLVAEDHREEVKKLVALVAERLRVDAKGKSIRGIAVLPAEKDRLVHYHPFWYMIAEELDILTKARFDWIEPVDIKVGLPSSIGKLDKSDYVVVLRVASLGDELEREVPNWLAKSTGAKVGPVRYVTLAKSSQSV